MKYRIVEVYNKHKWDTGTYYVQYAKNSGWLGNQEWVTITQKDEEGREQDRSFKTEGDAYDYIYTSKTSSFVSRVVAEFE